MRAGLNTIQQTLTPEAASVLNHSIAEAGRRNHGQTTPLHVAATLLASPSGFLRQACIRSHPNSSHPLQCRALELCFSVALERLPTAQNMSPGMEPPISNALMAALKRAQAHQRRGCPEQQQQPLLAVKVELNQLIISILDDPSVSRVMREASFSSPAVKATIEQSLNSQPASVNSSTVGIGLRPTTTPAPLPMSLPTPMSTRNLYLNPRLQQGNSGQHRNEEVKRIVDILLRTNKRNPILVGELEPEAVLKELLRRIENSELDEGPLKNVQVIAVEKELASDKTQMPVKLKELGDLIESQTKNSNSGGIVLDLGDLKWLVEKTVCGGAWGSGAVPQPVVSETERMVVEEMGKLLATCREGGNCRIWVIGTATCETYLRCQVYHPSMEDDWDLQAVPITSRSALPGMFPRLGTNGILSRSVESLSPLKSFPTPTTALPKHASGNLDPTRRLSCCPQCKENYEQEVAELVSKEFETASSENKSEVDRPPLPQWLQNAKINSSDDKTSDKHMAKDQEMIFKQKSKELQNKWSDKCLLLHPNSHHNLNSERSVSTALLTSGLYNPNLLVRHPFQPKLQQTRKGRETLQLKPNLLDAKHLTQAGSPPGSPVRTDLALGRAKTTEADPENTRKDCVQDLLGCFSSEPQTIFRELQREKFDNLFDADSFKKLLKSLMEKVWWQREAASAVATTVTQCKLGNGKWRGAGSKGDIWLLFTGPDRVGKKKMASVLSEQVCGANPIMISLGSGRDGDDGDVNLRGKTALDRIAEAVRRNPFSVIMLDKIDEADMLVRGSIKRAMERGRLADSYGREISLGNVIFILTANSFPNDLKNSRDGHLLDEKYLASISSGGWQLRLSVGEKSVKRQAKWLLDRVHRPAKPRKEMGSNLSLDLNLAVDIEDDKTDGSNNSSDLTIDHEGGEHALDSRHFSITSLPHDLVNSLDDTIFFKRVDAASIRRCIENSIADKFSTAMDHKLSIEVEEEALEKILGGIWLGNSSLDEWSEKVLVPSFHQLRAHLPSSILVSTSEAMVVRLQLDSGSQCRSSGDWLPCIVTVTVDGA